MASLRHPVLRALLRVMVAPDSTLALALGNYAKTFVQWHLWDAVGRGLPRGRLVWSRTAVKQGPGGLVAEEREHNTGVTERLCAVGRLAREFRTSSVWVPKLTPDGRLYGRTITKDGESVLSFWNNRDEWPDQGGSPIAGNETANDINLYDADRHAAYGYTVAWGTGELFVLYEEVILFTEDEATGGLRHEIWVLTGPFGRGQDYTLVCPRGPIKGLAIPRREGFSTDCDHWGRRLYLMEADDGDYEDIPPTSRVTVVDAGALEVVGTWQAPYAEGMVYTDSGYVVLAHNTGRDPRVGMYTPGGDLVSWWPLDAGGMGVVLTGRLRLDPRTGRLVVLMVVSISPKRKETLALVYE
jgi:hypothetical protein